MKKSILTKDKYFYITLLSLAIPMIFQYLITFSVGLADNIMIGRLGDESVSGVYIGNQIQTVLQVVMGGVESALLLLSAQYWGKKDKTSIVSIISIAIKISFTIGLIFTVVCSVFPGTVLSIFTKETDVIIKGVDYLSFVSYSYLFFCLTQSMIAAMRSIESARIGLYVSIASLVSNIILNYIFIFGKLGLPAMGVTGASLATLISRIIEFVIIFIYVFYVDKKIRFKFSSLKEHNNTLFKDYIKYGLPLMAGQLVWGVNLTANSIILGHLTTSVITATSLANTLNSLMYVGMNGLAGAIGVIIGKEVGSGDLSKIKEYSRTTQIILLMFGLFSSLMFWLLRDPYISLYNISSDAAEVTRQFINVLRVTGIGTCYQAGSLMGLIKSGGDVKFVFKNDTIHVFLIVIPSALIAFFLGAEAWVIFGLLKIDQLLKCIPAFFKIRSYNWMKNLTR